MKTLHRYTAAIPAMCAVLIVGCQQESLTAAGALRRLKTYACDRNFSGMQAVITQFPNVLSETGEMDETVLHEAAMASTPDVISFLVNAGANINSGNINGETPLWLAVAHGKTDNVRELIRLSADLHIPSAENAPLHGVTPLEYAAGKDYPEIVRLLVKHGADVNRLRPDETMLASALHWAACLSHADSVDTLLECGADPNLTTEVGLTPLMMVVYRDFTAKDVPETESDIRVVKSLLAAGASCTVEFVNGETPVSHSQRYKNFLPKISKLLVAAEAKEESAQVDETESQPGVD